MFCDCAEDKAVFCDCAEDKAGSGDCAEEETVFGDSAKEIDSVCVGRDCAEQLCSMTSNQGEESKLDVTGV